MGDSDQGNLGTVQVKKCEMDDNPGNSENVLVDKCEMGDNPGNSESVQVKCEVGVVDIDNSESVQVNECEIGVIDLGKSESVPVMKCEVGVIDPGNSESVLTENQSHSTHCQETVTEPVLKDEKLCSENVFDITYAFNNLEDPITRNWKDFSVSKENFTKGCKWAPDGTCIVTNSFDNILRFYDLPAELHCQESWDCTKRLDELKTSLKIQEGQQIYDYCWYPLMSSWNPLSCCLVSTCKDGPIHLWDAFTGELRCTYRPYNQVDEVVAAHCVSFDPFGEKLYCGFKATVRIFTTANPGRNCEERILKGQSLGPAQQRGIVSCIKINPAMPSIYAVGSYLKTVGLYTEPYGEPLCQLRGNQGGVTHMVFSPDGTKLFTGGRKDHEIICWDLRNPGSVLFILNRTVLTNQRIYFDITPNGQYVFSGNSNGSVSIWDLHKSPILRQTDPLLEQMDSFQAHTDCVNGVSLHQQYPILATSSGQRHFENVYFESDSEGNSETMETWENSLKLWWLGKKR